MAKYLVFLFLITVFSLLSCDPITTEPPEIFDMFFAGCIKFFVSNSSCQDVGVGYYLLVFDKDKSNMYVVFSANGFAKMNENTCLIDDTMGFDAYHYIFRPGILLKNESTIKKMLLTNEITNLMISFLIEITKGSNKISFTGFDKSITNITNLNANVYGLGYFDGVFDCGDTITNILRVVPLASYTDTYYEDFLYCNIDVTDSEVKATFSVVYYGEITTNISF